MTTTEVILNLSTIVFAGCMTLAELGMAFDHPNNKRFHYFAACSNALICAGITFMFIRG